MSKQGVRIKVPGSHGTEYAYRKHLKSGEPPCQECRDYNRDRMRRYRMRIANGRMNGRECDAGTGSGVVRAASE